MTAGSPEPPERDRYPLLMATEPLEDERGVDRADLRERLRLTPAARVQRLVDEVRVWSEIREAATSSGE